MRQLFGFPSAFSIVEGWLKLYAITRRVVYKANQSKCMFDCKKFISIIVATVFFLRGLISICEWDASLLEVGTGDDDICIYLINLVWHLIKLFIIPFAALFEVFLLISS